MTTRIALFRRTLSVAAVWAVVMAGLLLVSPSSASGQEAVEPGLGNAFAQGFKIDPRSGRLSLGIGYGVALAGHQNTVAQAESRSVDLGIIGDTLAGEGCDGGDPTLPEEDQPQHLTASSRDEDAGTEKRETEYQVEKVVFADGTPLARSEATTMAAGDASAIQIGATHSETESGIVDGARVARARTEVSSITFAGGAVVLTGLEWNAVYQTAPTELTEASFTIDGIEVAGQRLPIPEENPAGPIAEANAVLNPLGFTIEPPTTRIEAGIAFVDPMRIGVVPSDTRDGATGPLFGAVQPIRQSLFDAIIEQDCGNATYILVADIVLGSITGAGSLSLEVGGVTATSDELVTSSFLEGLPGGAPSLPPAPPATGGTTVRESRTSPPPPSSGPATPGPAPAPAAVSDPSPAPSDEVAVGSVQPVSGSRGGPLVAVGLGGLALLTALALADVHKMRRAQRSVLMEVVA